MPKFTYKALRKEDNTSYEAIVEARDRFAVYEIVRKEGGQVVSVKEKRGSADIIEAANRFLSRVNTMDKIILMRNLGAMLKAGLSVTRALNVMERQARNDKLRNVLKDVQRNIQDGSDLNSALAKHPKVFSSLMIAMVKAGEESGSLAESCIMVADQTERMYELKKKVRGAMIYPSVILTVLAGVGALMMIYIVPSISTVYSNMGSELPASTKAVLFLSDVFINYKLYMVAGIIGFIAALSTFKRTRFGKRTIEVIILRIPIIGELVRETNSARTGRTLSSLLRSGVNVVQAMEITSEVLQNSHYKEVIERVKVNVQKGSPIAEVFLVEEKLYPPLVGELIAVGEETGNLPDMLAEVAKYYENDVDQKTKNMSTIIEPILMLVVGGGVGFFAVAMLTPIYSLLESFN